MKQLFFLVVLKISVIGIESSNDCTNADCRLFVNSIKNSINDQVNPCDDFYEYACGNWAKHNPIPRDAEIWNVYHSLEKYIREKIIGILNDNLNISNSSQALPNARRMYDNCMNLENIEKYSMGTILLQLRGIGGWPAIMRSNEWTPSVQALHRMHVHYVQNLNLQLFYSFIVYPDAKNSTVKYLHFDVPEVLRFNSILRTISHDSPKMRQWIGNVTQIIMILANEAGNNVKREDAENDVNDVIDFAYSLFEFSNTQEELAKTKRKDHFMTVNDFQKWYNNHSHSDNSKIMWIDFFQTLFKNTKVHFTAFDTIKIVSPEYIANVAKLMDSTSIRTIVNYIQLNWILELIIAVPKNLRDIVFKLEHIETGIQVESERAEICMKSIGFGHATSYEYVKRYIHPDIKQSVHEIITQLSDAAIKILNRTSWLMYDEVTYMNRKLSAIRRLIVYPDWYDEPSAIDDYYQQCTISDNFMENLLEVKRFEANLSLSELAEPVDKNKVLQYATLGETAGHEISHAFDSDGVKYNDEGDEIHWLSNKTKNIYDAKVECFIEQFNKYKIYEVENETKYVNGDNTKDENIGDLSGLNFAYKAYQDIRTLEDINLHVPGLESYTDEQLFFLAFANSLSNQYVCSSSWENLEVDLNAKPDVFSNKFSAFSAAFSLHFGAIECSASRPAYYMGDATLDSHAAPRFRIIGTLSNVKEFSTAFNCPVNSTMNPSNKCSIWGANN